MQKLRLRHGISLFLNTFFCAFCRFLGEPPALGSLFVAKQSLFWCAVRGVQQGLGVLAVGLKILQDILQLQGINPVANYAIFYFAQKGIAKTMYATA